MRLKKKRLTAPAGAHEPRNSDQFSRPIASENTPHPLDLQAHRIAARFRVPLDMARVVASLAFGEARA